MPNDLARHYSRFRVAERLLLTGHSHQAWPDVAFDAQQRAWLDAADLVDDKWARAEEVAGEVRAGWRRLLRDSGGDIALGQNTHELIVRLLSALLPMFGNVDGSDGSRRRVGSPRKSAAPALVTTDGEFHTIRRQLDRLGEEGVRVTRIAARPVDTLAERLAAAIDHSASCVLVSSVLYETAEIVPGLDLVARACLTHGAPLLLDVYHHLNVVPFDVEGLGLGNAFVVGGGYKYCQLGEGNCFLRLPPGCELRPILTGWFSEFADLEEPSRRDRVRYGQGPARFAGATYDPTSHYRAAAVFAFHQRMTLTPERLRVISRRQVSRLVSRVEALDLDPAEAAIVEMAPERRGGFVAIRMPRAVQLVRDLRARGVYADARGEILRLGPAPYLADEQIDQAAAILGDVVRS